MICTDSKKETTAKCIIGLNITRCYLKYIKFYTKLQNVFYPENNQISNVSLTGSDIRTKSNRITQFSSSILYPNYPNVPILTKQKSLYTLFENFYSRYPILTENTQYIEIN